jgi:lipid II:glycine glycyltransferase (peptidoglycan interpeptide bridge formation enzyme)
MQILKNHCLDRKKWVDLISNSFYSSPFQTQEFYEFYNSLESYTADVFAVEEKDEYKALVLVTVQKEQGLKSSFSKRGIIYGGPILINSGEKFLSFLLSEIYKYYKNDLIYIEVRNNHNYSGFLNIYTEEGWKYEKRLNVQLKTSGFNCKEILANMKYNRRRELNQSYKEGAIVRLAENKEEVISLYQILNDLYKTRVKVPLPQQDFFVKLSSAEIGKIFIVVHNQRIIGGSFNVFYNDLSICTLYYCGIRDYHKRIFPTHLAIMGAIDFAIQNNLKLVDFMGAGRPDEEYGVRDYKLQFGGDLVEHGRFIIILKPLFYRLGKLGLRILKMR